MTELISSMKELFVVALSDRQHLTVESMKLGVQSRMHRTPFSCRQCNDLSMYSQLIYLLFV